MRRVLIPLLLAVTLWPNPPASAAGSTYPCNEGTLVYSPVPGDTDTRPVACVGAKDDDGNPYSWTRVGDVYIFGPNSLAWSDCLSGLFCLWSERDYDGLIYAASGTAGWVNLPPLMDNAMSSWRNHRTADSKWAYGSGGAGTVRCADSNSSLAFVGATDNNQASSIRNFSGETCS